MGPVRAHAGARPRVYGPLYRSWHRVEWEGLENIPTDGGALLVANHAGAIPADAPAIMHGIETELGRPVYGLADDLFKRLPVVGTVWSRVGGVLAHPDNAYRLLREQQQLALVFPEGTKGTGKTYGERYQLRRFGRGGFVQIAMRAGVPVVPIAVVGAEEAMPILYKSTTLAKLLGLPYVPITANMLAFGPLGGLRARCPPRSASGCSSRCTSTWSPTSPATPAARSWTSRSASGSRSRRRCSTCSARASRSGSGERRWASGSSSPGSARSGAAGWPRPSRPTPPST